VIYTLDIPKCPKFFSDFNPNYSVSTNFHYSSYINFMKISFSGSQTNKWICSRLHKIFFANSFITFQKWWHERSTMMLCSVPWAPSFHYPPPLTHTHTHIHSTCRSVFKHPISIRLALLWAPAITKCFWFSSVLPDEFWDKTCIIILSSQLMPYNL
jgi:hypothetical protein